MSRTVQDVLKKEPHMGLEALNLFEKTDAYYDKVVDEKLKGLEEKHAEIGEISELYAFLLGESKNIDDKKNQKIDFSENLHICKLMEKYVQSSKEQLSKENITKLSQEELLSILSDLNNRYKILEDKAHVEGLSLHPILERQLIAVRIIHEILKNLHEFIRSVLQKSAKM